MNITDSTIIRVQNTTRYIVNTQTGAVVVSLDTGGAVSEIAITVPSELLIPEGSTLTFLLNGDVATITRV